MGKLLGVIKNSGLYGDTFTVFGNLMEEIEFDVDLDQTREKIIQVIGLDDSQIQTTLKNAVNSINESLNVIPTRPALNVIETESIEILSRVSEQVLPRIEYSFERFQDAGNILTEQFEDILNSGRPSWDNLSQNLGQVLTPIDFSRVAEQAVEATEKIIEKPSETAKKLSTEITEQTDSLENILQNVLKAVDNEVGGFSGEIISLANEQAHSGFQRSLKLLQDASDDLFKPHAYMVKDVSTGWVDFSENLNQFLTSIDFSQNFSQVVEKIVAPLPDIDEITEKTLVEPGRIEREKLEPEDLPERELRGQKKGEVLAEPKNKMSRKELDEELATLENMSSVEIELPLESKAEAEAETEIAEEQIQGVRLEGKKGNRREKAAAEEGVEEGVEEGDELLIEQHGAESLQLALEQLTSTNSQVAEVEISDDSGAVKQPNFYWLNDSTYYSIDKKLIWNEETEFDITPIAENWASQFEFSDEDWFK